MSVHWTIYCADCEEYGPDIRRSGGVSLTGLFPRYHPGLSSSILVPPVEGEAKLAWMAFLDKHEWHKLELHRE